ncbi:MAG: response regulator, partial [Calditrichaeota bacterium]
MDKDGMKLNAKILIVDDDRQLLQSCAKILKSNGHTEVVTVDNPIQAEEEI